MTRRSPFSKFIAARIGAGIRPTVITSLTCRSQDEWGSDIIEMNVTDVELFQSEGDLRKVQQRLSDVDCDDIVVDVSSAPSFAQMFQANGYYSIRTGDTEELSTDVLNMRVGRLILLSDMTAAMSRGLLRFGQFEKRADVRSALTEVQARPPRNEEEGLLLLDTSANDDISLSVALAVYRANRHRPDRSKYADWSVPINK